MEDAKLQQQASARDNKDEETNKQRQFWYDKAEQCFREVWKVGDGDGTFATDYHGRLELPPIAQRWRLYQHSAGEGRQQPPKFVLLDDEAVHAVSKLRLSAPTINHNWSYDFAVKGRVRSQRLHRGKPVIADEEKSGLERYVALRTGTSINKYYLTGEKDFQLVDNPSEAPKNDGVQTEAMQVSDGEKGATKKRAQPVIDIERMIRTRYF